MGLSVLAVQMKTFASFPLCSSMKSYLDDLSRSTELRPPGGAARFSPLSPSLEITEPTAPLVRNLELRSCPHRSDFLFLPANAHAAGMPRKSIHWHE